MRLVTDYGPLFRKTRTAFLRAAGDVRDTAAHNLGSSRSDAVTVRHMPSGRARVQTNLPYGLIRQWGGVIRPKRFPYLHFRTRQGNWVRTKVSRQQGTHWLSRAGGNFGRHMTAHLRRLG